MSIGGTLDKPPSTVTSETLEEPLLGVTKRQAGLSDKSKRVVAAITISMCVIIWVVMAEIVNHLSRSDDFCKLQQVWPVLYSIS